MTASHLSLAAVREGKTFRPRFAAEQHTIPADRRAADLFAFATAIADDTDPVLPVRLESLDRVAVAMLLPETHHPTEVLKAVIGELHAVVVHERGGDHNTGDEGEAAKHLACAWDIAAEAVAADERAARRKALTVVRADDMAANR